MRISNHFLPVIMMVATTLILTACEKENDDPDTGPKTLFGPSVNLGNGTASTYIIEDVNGDPLELGVTMTEDVLENLPDQMRALVLELPSGAATDFYTHVLLDWNPAGHEPPGVYDLPHFDLHFYIIPSDERMGIGPGDMEAFAHAPDEMYVPTDYFQTEGGVPQMGAHWLDSKAPELNGEVFANTFIWGSYDGAFIFWEPMITRDYLLSNPVEEMALKLPDAYQQPGWYATSYKVAHSSGKGSYEIALTGLTYREASMMK